tara:strand:- start:810 stop:1016 length:207 start_codon:yes stop_codon:yes gene_type:complete
MKKYITSDIPRLSRTGDYISIVRKSNRRAVKTWKTVLKIRQSERKIKVQEKSKPLPTEMVEWLQRLTG